KDKAKGKDRGKDKAKTKPPSGPIDPYAQPETAKVSSAEAEKAYKTGLQLFARGDTSGALASLKTAQSGNSGHAGTQRALGMVYEKMGKKALARAAFQRYLKLAPRAS